MPSPAKTISPTLRTMVEIIHREGLSYNQVCYNVGINCNSIWWWKNGHKTPSIISVESVLHSLGYQLKVEKICVLDQ